MFQPTFGHDGQADQAIHTVQEPAYHRDLEHGEPKEKAADEDSPSTLERPKMAATADDQPHRDSNSSATLTGMASKEGGNAAFRGKVDPFAGHVEGGIEYKNMVWWQASMVMVAETISLGILSLPQTLAVLGIIPGIFLLVLLGAMATYTGYVIGQLKLAYPHIHSMADAGEVLFGRWFGELLGVGQLLFYIFIMGSHILTFSIMMNAITDHGTCTITFMVVGTVLSLIFTLPRTLKNLSFYSIASFISIIGAVLTIMIGVGISRPGFQEIGLTGHFISQVRLWPAPSTPFHTAFLAVANMIFAYAGHVAFFSFISELKNPRDFPKALALLQVSDISMYIITAVVVYYYAGNHVASPALDSAGPLVRKIAYGIAIPTIVIAGVVNGHVAAKYLYVRLLRNSAEDVMHQKSFKARGLWFGICAVLWVVSWLIAEAVPVFNDLLGLTSALFASWFTFGLSGMFWIYLNLQMGDRWWKFNPKQTWNWKKTILLGINVFNVLVGAIICVVGLYATAKSISENSVSKKPFSCANNAAH